MRCEYKVKGLKSFFFFLMWMDEGRTIITDSKIHQKVKCQTAIPMLSELLKFQRHEKVRTYNFYVFRQHKINWYTSNRIILLRSLYNIM